VFHALGDVDELNSAIGVAQEYCTVDQEDLQQQVGVQRLQGGRVAVWCQ
jgi:cob(I)alamin adenosyltransferase